MTRETATTELGMSGEGRYSDSALYRRSLSEIKPYWLQSGVLFLLGLLSSGLALLVPLPMKIAVDNVLGSEPIPWYLAWLPSFVTGTDTVLLAFIVLLLVAVTALAHLQETAAAILRLTISERVVLAVRGRLFAHAQRLSPFYHDTRGSSDATYRIQYDVVNIPSIPLDSLIPALSSAVAVGSLAAVAFGIDWQLALIGLAGLVPHLLITHRYRRRLRGQSREIKDLETSALGVVQEVFGSLRVVQAFGQEGRERDRYVETSTRGMHARIRMAYLEGWFTLLSGASRVMATGALLYIGITHVQEGTLTLGSLLLVIGYLSQVLKPVRDILKMPAKLQIRLMSAERAYRLLDERPDVVERPSARGLGRATGRVEFDHVTFGYSPAKSVLKDITFAVEPGTRVGIAGPTGAGKTTLMSLLARFVDPAEGGVYLDGVDLRDYRLADLRDQFSIVLQEPVLFMTSIAENIGYARPGASMAEIIQAAKAADIHDFVMGLAHGYDTRVGERGMTLSGGERQRVSLARAFLKDSPILLLDEPTSSVDVKTEAAIMEAMDRLMKGRTSFMIAHRLATLRGCDRVLQILGGRLVESPVGAGGMPIEVVEPSSFNGARTA